MTSGAVMSYGAQVSIAPLHGIYMTYLLLQVWSAEGEGVGDDCRRDKVVIRDELCRREG